MPLEEALSIGILGAASIAKKNSRAASHPSAGCKIVAIASRNKEKGEAFVAEVFADAASAPIVIGGDSAYSTLIGDKSCEALYIPLPTKLHGAYVSDALGSGKHVLLEKPVASSAEEYRQMLITASRNGRLLMDGTMFVHHPRTKEFVKSIPNPSKSIPNPSLICSANINLNLTLLRCMKKPASTLTLSFWLEATSIYTTFALS
jgi:predicted dehydrogenase